MSPSRLLNKQTILHVSEHLRKASTQIDNSITINLALSGMLWRRVLPLFRGRFRTRPSANVTAMPLERASIVAGPAGMVTLRLDGWAKACAGVTTVEEILRVTQEDA